MNYRVVEKFVSINGEGRLAGELAVFIRFAGCNLECSYCDTSWANMSNVETEILSKSEIYDYIKSTGVSNVTLTGGEPLLQEEILDLIQLLANDDSLNVEIETNGSQDIRAIINILPKSPAITLDYKSRTSNMEDKNLLENYNYLRAKDTVKFVVGDIFDLKKAHDIICEYNLTDKCNVHLSGVYGGISLAEIVNFMIDNKLNKVKLQPQLHKFIWEANLRGV